MNIKELTTHLLEVQIELNKVWTHRKIMDTLDKYIRI